MKKYLLLIACIFIGMAGNISHAFSLSAEEVNIIDQFITRRHAHQPANALQSRVETILTRIDDLQQRARMTEKTNDIILYIEARLTNILNALLDKPLITLPGNTTTGDTSTGSTTSPQTAGLLTQGALPTQQELNPLILAGIPSGLIWKMSYTIQLEPMSIQKIVLSASRDDISSWVREFGLYDETGKLIATASTDGRTITFDGFSLTQNQGSHEAYIALLPYTVDAMYQTNPVTFTLSLSTIEAKGAYSHNTITPQAVTISSPTITISPVGIDSVEFLSSWNGLQADTFLGGDTTLGLISITTPEVVSQYDQNIMLDTLTVTVTDNTVAQQVATNMQLDRVDTASSSIGGTVVGNTVQFNLSNLVGYNRIEQGQQAIFRIRGNIPLHASTSESAQISLRNLKNGGITYHLEGNATSITTIQQWSWEVFGPIITD